MTTTADELREEVRRRYAESALAVESGRSCGCGSGTTANGDPGSEPSQPLARSGAADRYYAALAPS